MVIPACFQLLFPFFEESVFVLPLAIGKILLKSPIVINVPIRASLAVETKDLLFLWLAYLNNKAVFVNRYLPYSCAQGYMLFPRVWKLVTGSVTV